MNTTLAAERSLNRDAQLVHDDVRSLRISPVDRLSLRLGLWLLLRSTRGIHRVRDHEGHDRALLVERARQNRDRLGHDHLLRAYRA